MKATLSIKVDAKILKLVRRQCRKDGIGVNTLVDTILRAWIWEVEPLGVAFAESEDHINKLILLKHKQTTDNYWGKIKKQKSFPKSCLH